MFRLAITGDTHYPSTSRAKLDEMARRMREADVHALAIIGDIGEVRQDFNNFRVCLDIFRDVLTDIPILVLAGNHDLWVHDSQDWDSRQLFEDLLPTATRLAHCHWLETENFVQGDIAFVGSYLHYDYSAKDKVGVVSQYPDEWFEQNRDKILNDRFLKGLPRDIDFAKELGDAFRMRLQAAQDDPAIRKIVVLTHVPCMEEQITRNPHDFQWAMATPYFGNLSHQDFIKSCNKVRFVVSAHSHRWVRATIDVGNTAELEIINLDADYGKPAYGAIEL